MYGKKIQGRKITMSKEKIGVFHVRIGTNRYQKTYSFIGWTYSRPLFRELPIEFLSKHFVLLMNINFYFCAAQEYILLESNRDSNHDF